jgi:hypothetical protein
MNRVIFFPLLFVQTEENLTDLLKTQDRLYYARVSFLNTIKRENPYQQRLAHDRLKTIIKERIFVVRSEDSSADECSVN